MVIGVLQFEVLIHDPESLKDKRRVINSLKDRLHREHQVSVAEVGDADNPSVALLGLAVVGRETKRVAEVLDRISAKLHSMTHARIGDVAREVIDGREPRIQPTLSDVDMRRVPGAGPDASDRTWAIDEPPRPPTISKEELDAVFGPRRTEEDDE